MIYSPTKPGISTKIDWSDPLAFGLIGCWLFNEGGGSKLIDVTTGIAGVIPSITAWTTQGLLFTETSGQAVTIPNSDRLNITSELTLFARVRWAAPGDTTWRGIVGKSGVTGYTMFLSGNSGELRTTINNTTSSSGFTVGAGQFVSVCITYKAAVVSFYINGIFKTTKVGPAKLASTTGSLWIGRTAEAAGDVFSGIISSEIIYNRALSANEILQLHELTKGW